MYYDEKKLKELGFYIPKLSSKKIIDNSEDIINHINNKLEELGLPSKPHYDNFVRYLEKNILNNIYLENVINEEDVFDKYLEIKTVSMNEFLNNINYKWEYLANNKEENSEINLIKVIANTNICYELNSSFFDILNDISILKNKFYLDVNLLKRRIYQNHKENTRIYSCIFGESNSLNKENDFLLVLYQENNTSYTKVECRQLQRSILTFKLYIIN